MFCSSERAACAPGSLNAVVCLHPERHRLLKALCCRAGNSKCLKGWREAAWGGTRHLFCSCCLLHPLGKAGASPRGAGYPLEQGVIGQCAAGAGDKRAAVVRPALSRWPRMLRASLSFLWVVAQPPAEGGQQGAGPGLRGEPRGSGPREGWREVRELPR